ncbi:hypothetical protein Taro_016165, partial [Colocasia esculenta]|nr:hypothetical protein [Colocasia esculenta]
MAGRLSERPRNGGSRYGLELLFESAVAVLHSVCYVRFDYLWLPPEHGVLLHCFWNNAEQKTGEWCLQYMTTFRNGTQISCHRQMIHVGNRGLCSHTIWLSNHMRNLTLESSRVCSRTYTEAGLLSPDLQEGSTLSSSFEGFTVTANANKSGEIKLLIDVSGSKTEVIFDDVFSKLVAAAQPIPGFRRIPRDVLLQILGPSKANRQTIKKIINTTVAEYVEK